MTEFATNGIGMVFVLALVLIFVVFMYKTIIR
jgi:uncharacterized membrane protein YukC